MDPSEIRESLAAAAESDRHVEVYEDAAGEFRWRRVSRRGNLPDEIVAEGGEGYTTRSDAAEAARRENPDDEIHYALPDPEEGSDAP